MVRIRIHNGENCGGMIGQVVAGFLFRPTEETEELKMHYVIDLYEENDVDQVERLVIRTEDEIEILETRKR